MTKNIKGTNIFMLYLLYRTLIGGIVLGYVWQLLLNGDGTFPENTYIFFENMDFWGLVIHSALWQQIGYMMIIYISGIQNIPGELIKDAVD